MGNKVYSLEEIRAISEPIAKRYGLQAMYLFGSYARGEALPYSDIDIRIEKGRLHGLWRLAQLLDDLEKGFDKPVDLVTSGDSTFLHNIRQDEVTIYVEH